MSDQGTPQRPVTSEKIAVQLRKVVDAIFDNDGKNTEKEAQLGSYVFARNGTDIVLVGAAVNLWKELKGRFSSLMDNRNDNTWLEDALLDLLTIGKLEPSTIDDTLLEIVQRAVREPEQVYVLIPIYNLIVDAEEVTIGDIRITRPDITTALMDKQSGGKIDDAGLYNTLAADHKEVPTAHIPVLGEIDTLERAQAHVEPLLDYLRFVGAFGNPPPSLRPSGLRGWYSTATVREGGMRLHGRRQHIRPFRLTEAVIVALNESGVWQFAEVLKYDYTPSEFERAILTAIYWVGSGVEQTRNSTKFLNFASALDGLFTERGVPIGRIVGEGVAFVLSDDPATRRELFEFVDGCYDKRNVLAHGGLEQLTDDDVARLEGVVRAVIERLISLRTQFTKPSDFRQWVFERRFGTA